MKLIKTIIVEDEYLVRKGLRTVIDWEKHGFTVVGEGVNGEEGLALYEEYHPGLIVTDIRMPKLGGLEMISRIRQNDDKCRFIVISAYDEFDYAVQAIQSGVDYYCLKGSLMDTDMTPILNGIREKLEQIDLNDRKYAAGITPEKVVAHMGAFRACRCICFPYERKRAGVVESRLRDKDIAYLFEIRQNYGYWLLGSDRDVRIKAFLENLASQETLVIGVSDLLRRENSGNASEEAMRQARIAYRSHMLHGNAVSFYETLSGECESAAVVKSTHRIRDLMQIGQYAEARGELRKIKEEICRSRSIFLLDRTVYHLVGILGEEAGGAIRERDSYELLMDSESLDLLFSKLENRISLIQKQHEEETRDGNYANRIKNYVDQHYRENIKVKELAEIFHLSPNYLGKMFYTAAGIRLTDYITEVRLRNAADLLSAGEKPLKEISEMTGFSDPYYFSKVFKKKFGISPREFAQGGHR